MNKKSLHTLEYDKIIPLLSECATSRPGVLMCNSLVPSDNPAQIRLRLEQTKDAVDYLIKSPSSPSFGNNRDLSLQLSRLSIGGSLNAAELLMLAGFLENVARIKNFGRIKKRNEDIIPQDSFKVNDGRDPKNTEIAEALNISANEVSKLKFYAVPTISLNESVNHENNGDELYIENVYHVDDQETPEDSVETQNMNESISNALEILPAQERDVLRRRFGIGKFDPQTLDEIAKLYGVKAERIRQIEEQALRRLKTNSKFDFLKDWVGSIK